MKSNKHVRKLQGDLQYKKRIEKYGLQDYPKEHLFAYKSHGKPCSCWACRGEKYDRAKSKQNEIKENLSLHEKYDVEIAEKVFEKVFADLVIQ